MDKVTIRKVYNLQNDLLRLEEKLYEAENFKREKEPISFVTMTKLLPSDTLVLDIEDEYEYDVFGARIVDDAIEKYRRRIAELEQELEAL